MNTLRGFEDHDYEAFAGVESAHPRIAEFDTFTLILDGRAVALIDNDGEDCCEFCRTFDNEIIATEVAEAIAATHSVLRFALWDVIVQAALSTPVFANVI